MSIIKAKRFSKSKLTKKKALNDAIDDLIENVDNKKLPDWIKKEGSKK